MRVILAVIAGLGVQPAAAQDQAQFRSPTGNIHCFMFAGDGDWWGARCDILEATRSFAVPPADCDLDWGHAFEVPARGAAGPVCAGDTVADPGAPVLGYGRSVSIGGVICTSEQTGMTCQNRQGHGFSLSRARQRVF
jgi:hypothetical protein